MNWVVGLKVMTTLFALFAEVERDLISERTREGLAKARASGRKLGRPKGSLGVSRLDGKEDEIRRFLELGVSKTAIAKITGVSRTGLRPGGQSRQQEELAVAGGGPPRCPKKAAIGSAAWASTTRAKARSNASLSTCQRAMRMVRLAQSAKMAHRDTSVSELCREPGIRPVTLYRYVGPQGQLREQGRKVLGV